MNKLAKVVSFTIIFALMISLFAGLDLYGEDPVQVNAGGTSTDYEVLVITNRSSNAVNTSSLAKAIKNQIPVALLLKGFSMTDWHWVICVGVRTGEDGKVYFRIIDNWNKTLKRFMPVNKKRPWISALSFEINKK